jgi:hypothetical protein
MKRFLSRRAIIISYLVILFIGLLLLITGYSFTSKILNGFMLGIIMIYPTFRFFYSKIPAWAKVSTSFVVLVFLVLTCWNLPVLIAFSNESKHPLQTWTLGGKKVVLERKQGWAGPPYLQYSLRDFRILGLFVKTIAHGYPDSESNESCKIELDGETDSGMKAYEFDKCNNELTRIKSNGK